ncbi:hypothetical protein Salat_2568600 [Sesamum alatum]|uniref:Uncharacterized protein n=1 Tax=Sesamum alatum TaxID=300844 RepID=A0AAE1XT03_9LAMI|nr:hypothetical protein Salat_2568600 [Sesamum alatum]
MDCGYTTSNWTSFDSSFSSPPPTTCSLPQKISGKMTRRTRASSSKEASSSSANEISPDSFIVISSLPPKMSSKSIVKTINLLGLPEGFEILTPIEYQRANNPPHGCVTVYEAQCVSGLRFPLHPFLVDLLVTLGIPPSVFSPRLTPGECFFHFSPHPGLMFIHEKPSSYGAWKNSFFFVRKVEWEVPLIWRSSLNDLPSINFKLVKERVKAAGLLDHGFKAKALVEEDLLILVGLHSVPDTYTGPESRYFRLQTMMNRAVVRKFLQRTCLPTLYLLRVRGQHRPLLPTSNQAAEADPLLVRLRSPGLAPSLLARPRLDKSTPPWRLL